MYRIGFAVLGCLLLACNGKDDKQGENRSGENNQVPAFSSRFVAASVPYQLADTTLLKNRDTATLSPGSIARFLPDSTRQKIFGKTTNIRYTPLVKIESAGKASYYVIKGTAGAKKAAFLLAFAEGGGDGAAIPFLVPDNDQTTSQVSSIDQSAIVTRAITQRTNGAVTGEGKDVLAFDPKERKFSLIMTDLLNDNPAVLVNPIDTFAKTHRLAGDYYLNKKNLVAVRDGRYPNQILVYIHTENSGADCIGELKGEFLLTSTTTAVYRQGGDPCILALTFKGNAVSMNEESGCGNYRGLDCPFSGSFTRKKEESSKEASKNQKQRKSKQ